VTEVVKDDDRIAKRVNDAHKTHASVTDTAVNRIRELLERKLVDRHLPTGELEGIAKALLSDMAPPSPLKTGVGNAD
jgi:hypothetical protein